MPPDRYNLIVEGYLRETSFYHVSQIGVVQCQSALVNALVERWRPETHTFHFPVGECAVTLEDVALILSLSTNDLPVTRPTLSNYEALEAECLDQFGVAPMKADCRGSFIKLVCFRALKDRLVLVDDIQIQRYVKCHIMLLFGLLCLEISLQQGCTGSFCRYSVTLPGSYSSVGDRPAWHTCIDRCVEQLVSTWHNWERENRPYRYRTLENYRRDLDVLQEGHFVWEPYAIGRTDPDVILPDIRQHSAIWSATILLISFECIEWHASDRLRRQFGLTQGVPNQERDLGEAHGEVLTSSKNQDWSGTHSFWVMHWMNRYSHVLVEHTVPSQHQADIHLHWYRGTYGDHLHLSQIEPQENQHGDPMHNQENQQVQSPPPPSPPQPPPPPSQTQAQQELEQFTPYIPDTYSADYLTPPVYQQYWSVPHQE
ncbi:serine/threonine-protein phosphatase 7 long form homolog [Arachis duranensis]|uniref:Serine/threonine-protein phosphatase 7 long form homolog n=1 Tax=Arachis duranensis TaxID=130453 RepID=A0A6P4CM29_ARADU|nr:serine/threonine-protein phosphatase 7 long form homolog [Arachis duranensis]